MAARREVEVLRSLDHPNVVAYRGACLEARGHLLLVMVRPARPAALPAPAPAPARDCLCAGGGGGGAGGNGWRATLGASVGLWRPRISYAPAVRCPAYKFAFLRCPSIFSVSQPQKVP